MGVVQHVRSGMSCIHATIHKLQPIAKLVGIQGILICKSHQVPGPDKDKAILLANKGCQKL